MIRLLALVGCAACGRVAFDAQIDAGPDAARMCDAFGPPAPLPGGANHTGPDDWSPSTSADNLTLYWYSQIPSTPGAPDIWISRRATADGDFPAGAVMVEVSAPTRDTFPRVTADGLAMVLTSDRDSPSVSHLYLATRNDPTVAFSTPVQLTELGSLAEGNLGGWISGDGLRILWSKNPGTGSGFDLYQASRPDRTSSFGDVAAIAEINTAGAEMGPSLSFDERELYFSSDRPGGVGMLDVWRSTRASRMDPWGPAENLSTLGGVEDDFAPYISNDSTTLLYSHNLPITGAGDADIWIATRSCVN